MSDLTGDELDLARAEEAVRQGNYNPKAAAITCDIARTAARLARENWKPEDPLLKEARDIAAARSSVDGPDHVPRTYREGLYDDGMMIQSLLQALRRGIEIERERAGS